jgi:hypothetical protein
MYSHAGRDSGEVKGLTLHTDQVELGRELHRSIQAMDARDRDLQARSRARRLQGLSAATVVLGWRR